MISKEKKAGDHERICKMLKATQVHRRFRLQFLPARIQELTEHLTEHITKIIIPDAVC